VALQIIGSRVDFYTQASDKLHELGLADLNARPYDCAFSVLD